MTSTSDLLNVLETSSFQWTSKKSKAVLALAQGHTEAAAAEMANVSDRTIRRWKQHPEFEAELDRLSLMVGIASRAERLRIAQEAVRQKVRKIGVDKTTALDWLKFAQSETDGIKLDLVKLLEDTRNDE